MGVRQWTLTSLAPLIKLYNWIVVVSAKIFLWPPLRCPYVARLNKLSLTFYAQMLNSHTIRHKIPSTSISSSLIMRLLAFLQTILAIAESSLAEFVDPNCPWVLSKMPRKWFFKKWFLIGIFWIWCQSCDLVRDKKWFTIMKPK